MLEAHLPQFLMSSEDMRSGHLATALGMPALKLWPEMVSLLKSQMSDSRERREELKAAGVRSLPDGKLNTRSDSWARPSLA